MLISAYSTRLEFVPHDFTPVDEHFRWHESGEQDAGFAASLSELEDYVSRAGVGQPAETVRLLIGHVRDTQRSYSFTLDGADPAQLARLTAWATEANAILVAEGALLDPAGRPLLAGGEADLRALYAVRCPLYAACAHYRVPDGTVDQMKDFILRLWRDTP